MMYLNPNGSMYKTRLLIREFMTGHEQKLNDEDQNYIDETKQLIKEVNENFNRNFLENGSDFKSFGNQACKDLFTSISFRNMSLTWKDIPDSNEENIIGPFYYPTDFGGCCFLSPHLQLKPIDVRQTKEELFGNLKADAKNGESQGLKLILDAERFNYAYGEAAGFKISLHHHKDKPMMQFSSQLIHTGIATEINLKPTFTYTTDDAIHRFSPEQRNCYANGEQNLSYLTEKVGYRYEMNNCLIDQVIRDIIWNCKCLPHLADNAIEYYLEFIPWCTGLNLYCANQKLKSISAENKANKKMLESNFKIGNLSKPAAIKCLPNCEIQDNNKEMSFAPYPEHKTFFYQKTFCDIASHILHFSCGKKYEERRFLINEEQPKICPILDAFDEYFRIDVSCKKWPENFFENYDKPNSTLKNELYRYAHKNLALVRIMMQSPYITKIKRDVAITTTNYVANTGGLLGLCLGFSFISCIEIIFWCLCCCKEFKKKSLFSF